MNKDDLLSKKLTEVEERKNHYIARRVESSDRERVGEERVDANAEPADGVSVHRASSAGDVTVELATEASFHRASEAREASRTLETDDDHPDGVICTWIECAQDRRSWAEVREEEMRCVPRPNTSLENFTVEGMTTQNCPMFVSSAPPAKGMTTQNCPMFVSSAPPGQKETLQRFRRQELV